MKSLPFPKSLPDFQRLFPSDAACGSYMEKLRWPEGFACPHCGTYPVNAFRSLLGIGAGAESPTYAELYSGEWEHPNYAIGT